MALDMFLKLTAGGTAIKGESRDSVHKGEIDVLSFNIGASRAATDGLSAGKAEFHDFSFVMWVDVSTPTLLEHLATGKLIDSALLTARKAGVTPVEFLKWTFSNVVVTGLSEGISGGEDRGTQEVNLAYQKIRIDYTEQLATGGAGATTSYSFDLTTQKA